MGPWPSLIASHVQFACHATFRHCHAQPMGARWPVDVGPLFIDIFSVRSVPGLLRALVGTAP